jgi:hypothetical protein
MSEKKGVSLALAMQIMGANFFGGQDAQKYFGIEPTLEDAIALTTIPFTEEVLNECKDTHILVAVFRISILDIIRSVSDKLFINEWYKTHNFKIEQFTQDKGETKWFLVENGPVEDSIEKSFNEQKALLTSAEETPSAQVMVYTIIGHYLKTKERLFEYTHIHTTSVFLTGERVTVGFVNGPSMFGIDISYSDCSPSDIFGLAAARKPSL